MQIKAYPQEVRLTGTLQTSYGIVTSARNVIVEIRHGETTGYGEAVPIERYGENPDHVLSSIAQFAEKVGEESWAIEETAEIFDSLALKSHAAQAAVDMALFDLYGKKFGIPLYQWLGVNPAAALLTSYTIGVDDPRTVAEKVLKAKDYPIIKLKIGGTPHDITALEAIRAVSDAIIRVDANAAWTPDEAIEKIHALEPFRIQFIEQPVSADDIAGLKKVRENVSVPIIADESCRSLQDIARLSGSVDGVNIKLAKCGGISQAVKMIHAARAHGLKVMIGCFLESSLAVTAAAHLTPLADYADLDPTLFLEEDPYQGVKIVNGQLVLPEGPGLGVQLNSNADDRKTPFAVK